MTLPRTLRLRCGALTLAPTEPAFAPALAALQPADSEHDPTVPQAPDESLDDLRRRILVDAVTRAWADVRPGSWVLPLTISVGGSPVGLQWLEAEQLASGGEVDSHSWLVPQARGRGYGVAARTAVLALAFELGARAAVTSARVGNHASLGVSRRLGYVEDGLGATHDGGALQLLRLTAERWAVTPHAEVVIEGLDAPARAVLVSPPGPRAGR